MRSTGRGNEVSTKGSRLIEMERNGNHPAGQRKEGCIGTKAPNGCESSGAKHNRARMFLTWYQVNARHPPAESLLKKTGKIAELTGEFKNTYWNLFGKNNYVNKTNGPRK